MKLHETFIIILDYVMEKQKKHAILLTHYIISKSRAKCNVFGKFTESIFVLVSYYHLRGTHTHTHYWWRAPGTS